MHSLHSSSSFILDQTSSLSMARIWDCETQGPPPKTTTQSRHVNLRVQRVIAPLPRRPALHRNMAHPELKRKQIQESLDEGTFRKENYTANLQASGQSQGQNSTSTTSIRTTSQASASSQSHVEWTSIPRMSHLERIDPLYDEDYYDPFEDDDKTLVNEPLPSPCEDVEMGEE